jgi:protein-S-isoprenylcysteine O-methyltransferase Ste14
MSRLPALGPRGEGWVVIQFAILATIAAAGAFSGGLRGPLSWVPEAIGVALLACGGALLVLAVRELGDQLTPFPRPRIGGRLVRSGVYRHARHPIYGGLVLTAFGWGMLTASPSAVGLSFGLLVFLELKARREEAWLAELHPDYDEYRARTRRFVPWVY